MPRGASPNALGGAITIALCGHWDHTPPCPLAPHYVTALPDGETVSVRILFATEPSNERRVRSLIAEALNGVQSPGTLLAVRRRVTALADRFPLY